MARRTCVKIWMVCVSVRDYWLWMKEKRLPKEGEQRKCYLMRGTRGRGRCCRLRRSSRRV